MLIFRVGGEGFKRIYNVIYITLYIRVIYNDINRYIYNDFPVIATCHNFRVSAGIDADYKVYWYIKYIAYGDLPQCNM